MDNTFIYALRHRETKEIFYVGKANNPRKRLTNHLLEVKKYFDIPKLILCLKEILDKESEPDLIILEEVPMDLWQEKEKHYISLYKERGDKLLNVQEGGRVFSEHSLNTARMLRRKATLQYSLDGIFIKEWPSLRTISKELGIAKGSLYCSLNTKQKTAGGFYWRYKISDDYPKIIYPDSKKSTNKSIFQILDNGEKIKWDSVRIAARHFNINEKSLAQSIRDGYNIKGLKFERNMEDKRWHKPFGKLNQKLINYNYVDVDEAGNPI